MPPLCFLSSNLTTMPPLPQLPNVWPFRSWGSPSKILAALVNTNAIPIILICLMICTISSATKDYNSHNETLIKNEKRAKKEQRRQKRKLGRRERELARRKEAEEEWMHWVRERDQGRRDAEVDVMRQEREREQALRAAREEYRLREREWVEIRRVVIERERLRGRAAAAAARTPPERVFVSTAADYSGPDERLRGAPVGEMGETLWGRGDEEGREGEAYGDGRGDVGGDGDGDWKSMASTELGDAFPSGWWIW